MNRSEYRLISEIYSANIVAIWQVGKTVRIKLATFNMLTNI